MCNGYYSFNRYMVECEFIRKRMSAQIFLVLIDTWWNVNILSYFACVISRHVLIDTWWNVNTLVKNIPKIIKAVLIDTWWNVNLAGKTSYVLDAKVLIDTWWNVNDKFI